MIHSSDLESRSNPGGLQEIRAWASRSPQSARPGFRAQNGPRSLRMPLQIAASLGIATLLLLALTGYRSRQDEQDTAHLAPAPAPEQAAASSPVPVEEEPPPIEAVADSAPPPLEPVPAPATLPAQPAPEEPSRQETAVVQNEPAVKEPRTTSTILVSRNAFESEPAVLLSEPSAEYPDAARGTGTWARVIVGFTIDVTGTVRNPIIESTRIQGDAPKAPFEEAALAAARRAQFAPARERGVPARSWSTLTFSFETGASGSGI